MTSLAKNINIVIIIACFISFGLSFIILPRLAHIASRINLLDYPTNRKLHDFPKPLVGGIGMFIGISLTALMFIP
ncbi:MAG: hypothetical protein L0Y62_02575, partial [Nitrospirae bacterium]|nr:hypothetical protein [Nitrospirota bacterium]